MGWTALHLLKDQIYPGLLERYRDAAATILKYLERHLDKKTFQRIHGDCHRGNLLQTDVPGQPKELFLLDFDDFGMGPPVQDFWMSCLGDEDEAEKQLQALLKGYRQLREFDDSELRLLEPLRGLRIIHYAAWIARRWSDPSFPQIFPQFGSESYWLDELQSLEPIAENLL
jgi:Ser/Thr protein kinase RdoA (MazF antagonist)